MSVMIETVRHFKTKTNSSDSSSKSKRKKKIRAILLQIENRRLERKKYFLFSCAPFPSFFLPKVSNLTSSSSCSSNEKYLFVRLVWELDVAELHRAKLSVVGPANF